MELRLRLVQRLVMVVVVVATRGGDGRRGRCHDGRVELLLLLLLLRPARRHRRWGQEVGDVSRADYLTELEGLEGVRQDVPGLLRLAGERGRAVDARVRDGIVAPAGPRTARGGRRGGGREGVGGRQAATTASTSTSTRSSCC